MEMTPWNIDIDCDPERVVIPTRETRERVRSRVLNGDMHWSIYTVPNLIDEPAAEEGKDE